MDFGPRFHSSVLKMKPWCQHHVVTLPNTNILPLKMAVSNKNLIFQWSIFRGDHLRKSMCKNMAVQLL